MANNNVVHNIVTFKNSQGAEARGTLMKLTRTSIVLEVYNPYSIVQLSEILQEVTIRRNDRVVYKGGAIVNNLVNTGLMLIVSATLVDTWKDLAGVLGDSQSINQEVERFVVSWEELNELKPGYQLVVSQIASFFAELSRWLEQVDIDIANYLAETQQTSGELLNSIISPL